MGVSFAVKRLEVAVQNMNSKGYKKAEPKLMIFILGNSQLRFCES